MGSSIDIEILLSGASFLFTAYFWCIQARRERPNLRFHQLSEFRAVCRRHPSGKELKRLCIQQIDTGGVLIVNHSTRQNSVIAFECFLHTPKGLIQGDWGYSGEDKPPWNVAPESTVAFSPACCFDVPEDYEVPDNLEFRIQFLTASGKGFSQRFTKQAPRFPARSQAPRQAA